MTASGTMNREEALSLLKELMIVCETIRYAPIVSLKKSEREGRWEVRVKWLSESTEKGCFDDLVLRSRLEVTETPDGYTTFHKPKITDAAFH